MEVRNKVVEMEENGLGRSGVILVPTLRIVLLTQICKVIAVYRVVMVLGHRVSSLRIVGLSTSYPLVDSMVRCIMVCLKKGGTSASSMV